MYTTQDLLSSRASRRRTSDNPRSVARNVRRCPSGRPLTAMVSPVQCAWNAPDGRRWFDEHDSRAPAGGATAFLQGNPVGVSRRILAGSDGHAGREEHDDRPIRLHDRTDRSATRLRMSLARWGSEVVEPAGEVGLAETIVDELLGLGDARRPPAAPRPRYSTSPAGVRSRSIARRCRGAARRRS